MDAGLLEEMAALGIAAFDPVGLAAMPVLLAQPSGVRRAWTFVLGSVTALMLMGVGFATGLGGPLLRFSKRYPWLDSSIELAAAVVLIGIGVWLLLRARRASAGGQDSLASESFTKRLQLPLALLFGFGFLLVVVQSLVDVVFLVAMVEMGSRALGISEVLVAVAVYTAAALLLQVLVVVGYQLLPAGRRDGALDGFNSVLERRGELIAGVLSLLLGVVLAVISLRGLMGHI